ncbi:MAG: shikimate dehydrogenase [Desulfobacterales bacterium]|nr:shikimate dehydrogenase [Desulfobacterales bacterium]
MTIDAHTELFGVIGNPVAHSLSPVMLNRAFATIGYNGRYLAFNVSDLPAAVNGMRALNVKGVSVTIPHKVAVMALLDDIDEMAQKIGAVNTIVNQNGRLKGYNTDCRGAIAALETETSVTGQSVALIGAGGAARAIGFGVKAAGGHATIFNRTVSKGQQLANDLDVGFKPLADFKTCNCDIVINTTPVGMDPQVDTSPIRQDWLAPPMLVMDIVYNPLQTKLLNDAREKGCHTISGDVMFVHQGAIQFERWTGRPAPLDQMHQAVLNALQGR